MNVEYSTGHDRVVEESITEPNSLLGASPMLARLMAPSVRFILLKGEPGTGKTTLAMEMLAIQGRGMYVSTRVSLDLLSRQNPKLRKLVDEGKITEYYEKINAGNSELSFEDNRLGTVQSIMQSVLSIARKNNRSGVETDEQMVVLDSWDALAGMHDSLERKKVEHAFLTMADANKIRLVFVSETSAITDADYMVDAIVELEDQNVEGRRVRRVVWKKIRGQEIPERSSLYSLHGGSFKLFGLNQSIQLNYAPRQFPATPHTDSNYSTGSLDLDHFLFNGGLPRGSITTLALDDQVRTITQWPLGYMTALNFVANGGCSVFLPPPEFPTSVVKRPLVRHLSEGKIRDSLRILSRTHDESIDPSTIPLGEESIHETMRIATQEILKMKGAMNKPCFYYISVDAADILYDRAEISENSPASRQFGRLVKETGDAALLVISGGSDMVKDAAGTSDILLRMRFMDGAPVIYSVKPPSPHFFHFAYDYREGYPKVILTPIV